MTSSRKPSARAVRTTSSMKRVRRRTPGRKKGNWSKSAVAASPAGPPRKRWAQGSSNRRCSGGRAFSSARTRAIAAAVSVTSITESPSSPPVHPRAGHMAVGAYPAVLEPPLAVDADEAIAVAAPVIRPPLGDDEEVGGGGGGVPGDVDGEVRDVVADERAGGGGGQAGLGVAEEGADRLPPAGRRQVVRLEGGVGGEEQDELVDPPAVDQVGVTRDQLAHRFTRHEFVDLHLRESLGGRRRAARAG